MCEITSEINIFTKEINAVNIISTNTLLHFTFIHTIWV